MTDVRNEKALKQYREGHITAAFGHDLLLHGMTSVPSLLLRFYKRMGITDGEMMLLIHLLRLRREERNFYPTAETLAEYLSADRASIERDLQALLQKEVLAVTEYFDEVRQQIVKGLDFEPLFEKLSEAWACAKAREIERTQALLGGRRTGASQAGGDSELAVLYRAFEREFGRPLSPMETEQIRAWRSDTDPVLILEALRRAVMMGKHNFKYIDRILLEWRKNNLRTLEAVAEHEREFASRRATRPRTGTREDHRKKALIKSLYVT